MVVVIFFFVVYFFLELIECCKGDFLFFDGYRWEVYVDSLCCFSCAFFYVRILCLECSSYILLNNISVLLYEGWVELGRED